MDSLRQQVARMFCIGFDGLGIPSEVDTLLKQGVGGVALFRRNVETPAQFGELCAELKRRAGRPLIIGIDQEGGRVMRLRGAFTDVPAMRDLGRTGDEELAFAIGQVLARECRAVNVDVVFAPVLDVDTNPDNPVIADRSLSSDPQVVSRLGAALIRGIQSEGVAACGKHFPGHGDTSQDSHHTLPSLERDQDRINAVELPPFRAAVDAGVASLMTAHVIFKALDPVLPATMSSRILDGLLRQRLKFGGALISDDMEMKAIAANYGTVDAVVQASNAGVDLFAICHSHQMQQQAIDGLIAAVESGRVPRGKIELANRRLDELCARYVKPAAPTNLDVIGCPAHQKIAQRVRNFGMPLTITAADPTEQMSR